MADTTIPTMKWAQRVEKVFVTIDAIDNADSAVTFSDGLLSINYTVKGKAYKLENMPLWLEIDADDSKWFRNDRCVLAQRLRAGRSRPPVAWPPGCNAPAFIGSVHEPSLPRLPRCSYLPCSPLCVPDLATLSHVIGRLSSPSRRRRRSGGTA